jgi:tetratricopeptide (TPR) repeat protein
VAKAADDRNLKSASRLWTELARYLRAIADYKSALRLYEQALKICRERLGDDHPTTKRIAGNLNSIDKI